MEMPPREPWCIDEIIVVVAILVDWPTDGNNLWANRENMMIDRTLKEFLLQLLIQYWL